MTKNGFTLIEVIVATFIASMITGVLFMSFSQINQTVRIAEQRMNFETRFAWFAHYFERDLAGACLVFQPDEQQTPTIAQQQPGKPGSQQAKPEPEKKEAEKKVKRIEKIFVYTHQAKRFESLNFITNNALPKFWGAAEVKLTPLIARVTYRLQEEKNKKGSFELVRQEDSELDPEKFSAAKPRGYTLVDGIKELSLKFTAKLVEEIEEKKAEEPPPQKPGQQATQQPKPPEQKKEKKVKITFKEVDDWNSDALEKAQKEAQKEKKKGAVQNLTPIRVEITGSLWDAAKKRTMPFKFIVPIIAYAEFKPRPKQQPQNSTPPPQKPGQPGQQQLPGGLKSPNTNANMSSAGDSDAMLKRMLKNMFSGVNQPPVSSNASAINAPKSVTRMPS